jgi:hypothetical protein
MNTYIIGAVVIAFVGALGYCEVQKKQEIKEAREEEQLLCKTANNEANLQSSNKTIKTIIKYEKVKSNVSNLDVNERTELLQQLQAEDFNFAD